MVNFNEFEEEGEKEEEEEESRREGNKDGNIDAVTPFLPFRILGQEKIFRANV